MKHYDETLQKEVEVQEEITPENGVEIFMNEPIEVTELDVEELRGCE